MRPQKNKAENPEFIRLLGQSLTNNLAKLFLRFLACYSIAKGNTSIRNTCPHNPLFFLVANYATPKKKAEYPDFIRLLGQSLTDDLATTY